MSKIFIYKVNYDINVDTSLVNVSFNNKKGNSLIISFNAYLKLKELLLDQYNIDMNKLTIIKNEYGKPYFKDLDIFFNISHSEDYFIIGLANKEIGVDIQKITNKSMPFLAKKMNVDENDNLAIIKKFSMLEAYYKKIPKHILDFCLAKIPLKQQELISLFSAKIHNK
jgi:hypothetical protein